MVYALQHLDAETDFWFTNNEEWLDDFMSSTDLSFRAPDQLPIIAYFSRKRGIDKPLLDKPPSAFGVTYVFFADDEIKDILERLEPGIHTLVSFELRFGAEEIYETFPYYLVRPQQFIRAIDVDNSDLNWIRRITDDSWVWDKKPGVPFAIKSKPIKGKHLWRDHATFVSDQFHDEIQRQGLVTEWLFEKQRIS